MVHKLLRKGIALATALVIAPVVAQERVDFRWESRTEAGTFTRDLVARKPNEIVAYVKKINGSTNTIGLGWDNFFFPSVQVSPRLPPYGTNDFFFNSAKNESYRMSNEGFDDRGVIRVTKSLFDENGNDISRGPITGEGIGAIYDVTPLALGRIVFDFTSFAAFKREGLQHKTSKNALTAVVVPAPEARTNEWRGSFLLYPEFKKDAQGGLAPEVYVSGSGKTNDTVVLYTHDKFNGEGVPVYTNIGGAFNYRDLSWTNSPARGYSAKSFPEGSASVAKPASAPSSQTLEQKAR